MGVHRSSENAGPPRSRPQPPALIPESTVRQDIRLFRARVALEASGVEKMPLLYADDWDANRICAQNAPYFTAVVLAGKNYGSALSLRGVVPDGCLARPLPRQSFAAPGLG